MSALSRFLPQGAAMRPLAITGALVLIVMSMVVPMPASVLDAGFALSIATAMLILVMASLVERPTDFQAFPVLLLISLVIRLSLTVSSTRLILTEGDKGKEAAGHVISGFAQFVAGGSLLIGLTVFAVISVVNFMVITKGSGRMAEVSARFALDSLPGKQLAIDGDLNSGAIDHEDAKRRRVQEQREISFYGSLDGASKFVKGDAIAGLVITVINLVVGLAAGIIVHGMPASEALSTYSHLTIGDGLVAQIPALITSMAAALLLSRGGATETTADLLSRQFGRNWQAPAVVSCGLAMMSIIPGMPTLIFLIFAGILGTSAYFGYRRSTVAPPEETPLPEPVLREPESSMGDLLDTDDINVEISPSLVTIALDEGRGLGVRINNLRMHIARSFGLILPDVRITDSKAFMGGDYLIRIQGVVRGRGSLERDGVLALGSTEVLDTLPGETIQEPVYGTTAKWIDPELQEDASIAGATVVTPMEVLSTHLLEVVRANLPALLTMSGLQRLLQELRQVSDEHRAQLNQRFFDSMIPDKVAPELLLSILRMLLGERLSIRNLNLIVDAIYESRSAEAPAAIYELVRRRLRGQITEQFTTEDGRLEILQLHPQWEAEFARAETDQSRQSQLPILQIQRRLAEAVRTTVSTVETRAPAVLAVADHRRRLIRSLLDTSDLGLSVLGLDEIDPAVRVEVVGVVAA
ncbi:flagellar biosynthesis protein FlhA [Paracoccus aminophilus]|uniref:Flagellar biosynthesis protein FlhA n=1 Tax=Paracoccus aminophilus JCM 7686 TaxID=1367847 RepID=S5XQV6_PARAH|nr:flagellar biosynthesis protein FlhA [Paracoccus aminophilus]AGT07452.1 flagellar biosynthesis protein FlhA [Paracoccus aminophilus JCM 7686]